MSKWGYFVSYWLIDVFLLSVLVFVSVYFLHMSLQPPLQYEVIQRKPDHQVLGDTTEEFYIYDAQATSNIYR